MDEKAARELPGFKKKSFLIPFSGGEIWFEHLDGIYENEGLVIEKLSADAKTFCRPSYPSIVAFVIDETEITDKITEKTAEILLSSGKYFLKICFIGADKKTESKIKGALCGAHFFLSFINDCEKAKEWLVS